MDHYYSKHDKSLNTTSSFLSGSSSTSSHSLQSCSPLSSPSTTSHQGNNNNNNNKKKTTMIMSWPKTNRFLRTSKKHHPRRHPHPRHSSSSLALSSTLSHTGKSSSSSSSSSFTKSPVSSIYFWCLFFPFGFATVWLNAHMANMVRVKGKYIVDPLTKQLLRSRTNKQTNMQKEAFVYLAKEHPQDNEQEQIIIMIDQEEQDDEQEDETHSVIFKNHNASPEHIHSSSQLIKPNVKLPPVPSKSVNNKNNNNNIVLPPQDSSNPATNLQTSSAVEEPRKVKQPQQPQEPIEKQQNEQQSETIQVTPHDMDQYNKNNAADNTSSSAALKFVNWDKKIHGGITLVISDFLKGQPNLVQFLNEDIPDFIDETIVIVTPGTNIDINSKTDKKIRIVYRGKASGNQDFCSVVINTKWFIETNVWNPRFTPHVPLVTDDGLVLATVTDTNQCRYNKYCRPALDLAEAFESNPQAFDNNDFLYHTGMRNEYCKRYMPVFQDFRFEVAQPNAISYMSFLRAMAVSDLFYKFVNKDDFKCRPKLPPPEQNDNNDKILTMCEQDQEQQQTECPLDATKDKCITLPACEFRPKFACVQTPVKLQQDDWSPQHEPMRYKQEMLQLVQSAHEYWINPKNYNGVIPAPVTPRMEDSGGIVPDIIFTCGDFFDLWDFFPYYEGEVIALQNTGIMFVREEWLTTEAFDHRNRNHQIVKEKATENSLLLGNVLYLHDCLPDFITDFPGKQLHRNIEPQEFNFLTHSEQELYPQWAKQRGLLLLPNDEPDRFNYLPPSDKVFVVGPHEDSPTSMRVPYLSFILANHDYDHLQMLFDPTKKPINTKEHFLIYSASHFIDFREEAAHKLALVGHELHIAGKCEGTQKHNGSACIPHDDNNNDTDKLDYNVIKSPHDVATHDSAVSENHELFKHYRFALVLENTNREGYITEKLCNAFLSGAIPIWYGTKQVFEIFNENAMIYYDIKNPQPALDRVAYLEQNPQAYNQMLQEEPILVGDGKETIEKWFSIRDEIGHGKRKKQLLDLIGLRDFANTAIMHSK